MILKWIRLLVSELRVLKIFKGKTNSDPLIRLMDAEGIQEDADPAPVIKVADPKDIQGDTDPAPQFRIADPEINPGVPAPRIRVRRIIKGIRIRIL